MRSLRAGWRLALITVAASTTIMSCGSEPSPSAGEIERVAVAVSAIDEGCLERKGKVPPSFLQREVSALVAAHRKAPLGTFRLHESDSETTMQRLLQGVIVDTFDTRCFRVAAKLKAELTRERRRLGGHP